MALIYIVEDDESIREIEEYALKTAGHSVFGCTCAKELYRRIDTVIPDLLLVDLMLPDEDGNEIVRKLRKQKETKHLPIIMVTAKTTELDMIKGLEDGADDYIKKPFSVMELITRVKALLRRTLPEEIKELNISGISLNLEKREVIINGISVDLTFKEFEVLHLLMRNAGVVVSRDIILDRVWGTIYEGESRTLDMHIKTLRQKLGEYGNHIRTVRNVGYVIE